MGHHSTVDATGGSVSIEAGVGDSLALFDDRESEPSVYTINGITDTALVRYRDGDTGETETMGAAEFEKTVEGAAIVTIVKADSDRR